MSKLFVSGLINLEITLRVEGFPIPYSPVNYPFNGVHSTISGVGYNLSKALTTLGNDVVFASLIGEDVAASMVRTALEEDGIGGSYVLSSVKETAQSVIIFDKEGKRSIHVDLKEIQESEYPRETFQEAIMECELAALCNINFSRPMLTRAKRAGKLVACDVHTISDLEDAYNLEFMEAAHILFMSDERLPVSPEEWAQEVMKRYRPEVLVIGLGAEGALLSVSRDDFLGRFPAHQVRPIINTIGAGDALFSAFIHGYTRTRDPYESLKKAILFASYKIGATSAADGFLGEVGLNSLYQELR